jgi:hypothetical protein
MASEKLTAGSADLTFVFHNSLKSNGMQKLAGFLQESMETQVGRGRTKTGVRSNMKNKVLAVLTLGLLAGPLAANATTSTCTFENNVLKCDLYESGGSTVINLSDLIAPVIVSEGLVGIFDLDAGSLRNVLEFVTDNGESILYFYFGVALPDPGLNVIDRTGDITQFGGDDLTSPFLYRVHHDYNPNPVPEPGSLALLGLGLVGLGLSRRRAKQA